MSSENYFWHKKTWDQFSSAYAQNHLPHAILLTGPQGVGKSLFSQKLVKSLLCENPVAESWHACNQCQGCKTYDSGANPDFMSVQLLEEKQQIGVDQIRQVSRFLSYSRSFNAYRVVLIHPAERMNQHAANSLLKSLEEPGDNTIIILTATHLSNITPTIKSRSQLLILSMPERNRAIEWLRTQKPDLENIEELLEISHGSPLIALNTSAETIEKRKELATDLLDVLEKNVSLTEIAKKWEKFDLETMLDWQIIWLQNILKRSSTANSISLQSAFQSKILAKLYKEIPVNSQWDLYQQLVLKKKILHTSVNAQINIENMLSLWLKASPI